MRFDRFSILIQMLGRRFALGRSELDPCDPLGVRHHFGRNRSVCRLGSQRPLKDARSDPCRSENSQSTSPREHRSRPLERGVEDGIGVVIRRHPFSDRYHQSRFAVVKRLISGSNGSPRNGMGQQSRISELRRSQRQGKPLSGHFRSGNSARIRQAGSSGSSRWAWRVSAASQTEMTVIAARTIRYTATPEVRPSAHCRSVTQMRGAKPPASGEASW